VYGIIKHDGAALPRLQLFPIRNMTLKETGDWQPFADIADLDQEDDATETMCIVDGANGIYVPQAFCRRYEKTDKVEQEDWEICLSGPDHEYYWESWNNILDNWGGEETDGAGNTFEISLYQDGDLYQCRRPATQNVRGAK
jgi:hypothetical protein